MKIKTMAKLVQRQLETPQQHARKRSVLDVCRPQTRERKRSVMWQPTCWPAGGKMPLDAQRLLHR